MLLIPSFLPGVLTILHIPLSFLSPSGSLLRLRIRARSIADTECFGKLMFTSHDNPLPPPHLGEKAQVFSDIVGSISRHYHCYYGERILTCRALAALGLPKSAGLDRRPILLCQDLVTAELTQCAEALPKKNWNRIHILTPNNLHGARITLTIPLTYRDQVQRELNLVRLDRGYGSWHGVALPWWSVYKGSE